MNTPADYIPFNPICENCGRITATEALRDRTTVTVDLDSRRIGELFEALKSVGEFKEKEPYALSQAGTLTIKIDISKRP